MGVVERRRLPGPLVSVLAWGRAWSLWVLPSGAGCCGPEVDAALHAARYDASRLGIVTVADPARADVLLVTGPVPAAGAGRLRALYEAMPRPSYVMAIGACAISGGAFAGGPAQVEGSAAALPVDVYVPGCPPRPEAILHGLGELQRLIRGEDPAVRWQADAHL